METVFIGISISLHHLITYITLLSMSYISTIMMELPIEIFLSYNLSYWRAHQSTTKSY
jgi:hypothetical protein